MHVCFRERETKRGLSNSLLQAKVATVIVFSDTVCNLQDEFDNLDMNPPTKKAAISCKREGLEPITISEFKRVPFSDGLCLKMCLTNP